MRTAGIDIGSRTIKLAVVHDGRLVMRRTALNSHDPLAVCQELIEGLEVDRLAATGWGSRLFTRYFDAVIVQDVRALALGAHHCHPAARTVLEIGGQIVKAVALDEGGALVRFKKNEHCASGTGRFLEITAAALGYSMDDFVEAARTADAPTRIEASCTVFAESEILALAGRGVPAGALALGLHQSVASAAIGLLDKLPVTDPVLLCGGTAHNACLRELLELGLQREVHVAERPQLLPAIGAALAAIPEELPES